MGSSHHQQQPTPQPSDLVLVNKIPKILPHERVFPIQIGSELFKLSGASLSSDGTDACFLLLSRLCNADLHLLLQELLLLFDWPAPSHHP